MGVLDSLSPGQKQVLMYAAPAVGVAALFAARSKKSSGATGSLQQLPLPSTDAIGTGDLAAFESSITDVLSGLAQSIYDLQNGAVATPQQPPTQQQPAPTGTKIGIPSGTIIGLPNGTQIAAGLVAPSQLGVSYVNPDTIIYNPTGGSETALFAAQFETLTPEAQAYLKAIASGN